MPAPMMQRLRGTLRPLTSLHVGSGTSLDPTQYVLHEPDDGPTLTVVDWERLWTSLDAADRARLDNALDVADPMGVRQVVQEVCDPHADGKWSVGVEGATFDELLRSVRDPRRMALVELFTRHAATGAPIIPGSAIKGAIRTALVDAALEHPSPEQRAQLVAAAREPHRAQRFEGVALGHADPRNDRAVDLRRDPLRQLAIADAPLDYGDLLVQRLEIVNRGGNATGRRDGILLFREVTRALVFDEEVAAPLELRFYPQLAARGQVAAPIGWPDVAAACNAFYGPRLARELRDFAFDDDVTDALSAAAAAAQRPGHCLLRLGRHSHVECVTVREGYRGKQARGGRSRTVADGYPMGWAVLRLTEE